jgi:hypothetical protein
MNHIIKISLLKSLIPSPFLSIITYYHEIKFPLIFWVSGEDLFAFGKGSDGAGDGVEVLEDEGVDDFKKLVFENA